MRTCQAFRLAFWRAGGDEIRTPRSDSRQSEVRFMGRKSIMGGVRPKGLRCIQFNFEIDGVRFRPTLPWVPTHDADVVTPIVSANEERTGR